MEIETDSTHLHVRQRGNGNLALIFLDCYGGVPRIWDMVANQLADRYQIVATGHRVSGESEAPLDGYHIAELADHAEKAIKSLDLGRYVLAGHSMDGKVAQLIASRRPNGLQGLVLVAPSPPSPTILSEDQRPILLGIHQSRASIEYAIDNGLIAKPFDTPRPGPVVEDSLNGTHLATAKWSEITMREDITAIVGSVDVPTIVISGELDQVNPIRILQVELLPHIAHAALHVLSGVGHLPPLEAPTKVAQIIANFLAAIENDSSGCKAPADVPLAFDAAMNAGDLDGLLAIFSNSATMRMTNGDVAQESPVELRDAMAQLLSMKPNIRNTVRRVLSSDNIALVLLDWTLSVTLPDGRSHVGYGTATQVMERGRDGGWRLKISNPLGLN